MPVWNLSQNVSFWGPFWVLMKQRMVFIKKYHLATSNYSNSVVNMTESRNILQRNTGSLRNKVLVQVATFKKRWKQWTLMFSIEIKFSPCLGVLTVIQTILSRQEILGNSGSHASVKILPLFCLSRKWTILSCPRGEARPCPGHWRVSSRPRERIRGTSCRKSKLHGGDHNDDRGGSGGDECRLEREFGAGIRGSADSGFPFSLWAMSQELYWGLQNVGTVTGFFMEMKTQVHGSLVHQGS